MSAVRQIITCEPLQICLNFNWGI